MSEEKRPLLGKSNIDNYFMPPLDIENIDDDGILALRDAIVKQACKDYIDQLRVIADLMRSITILEKEFKSDTFKIYIGDVDSDAILRTLRYNTPDMYLSESERKRGGLHLKNIEEKYFRIFKLKKDMEEG